MPTTLPDHLADFGDLMAHLGWREEGRVARSVRFHHIPTGNVYLCPISRATDVDRCIREVVLLSPEAAH